MKYLILSVLTCILFCSCGPQPEQPIEVHDGMPGFNSLLRTSRVQSSLSVCPSEMGLLVESGLDINRDNTLDNNEVMQANLICDGKNGNDGRDGKDGKDGADGLDGRDGQDGISPSLPGMHFVEFIDPCGDTPNAFDELILRALNGKLYGVVSESFGGAFTRFAEIPSGTWITADKTNCVFTVNPDLSVSW